MRGFKNGLEQEWGRENIWSPAWGDLSTPEVDEDQRAEALWRARSASEIVRSTPPDKAWNNLQFLHWII